VKIKSIGYVITVCEAFDGSVTLLYKGKTLQYTTFKRGEKSINQAVDQALKKQSQRINYKPKPDHP